MEVGPTCHYGMGGFEVEPDSCATREPGLFAARECAGGLHGANRLGGNSLTDLLVFGRRAGLGAAEYVDRLGDSRPAVPDAAIEQAVAEVAAGVGDGGEDPYELHAELQQTMNDLVGIVRTEAELQQALHDLDALRKRAAKVSAPGGVDQDPGWHLALNLRHMLLVAEAIARSALERRESRGGHARDDHPGTSAEWGRFYLVNHVAGDRVEVRRRPVGPMPADLMELFQPGELAPLLP
jgi:succinate dehydrogenase / fumarate reductase flavoprotein subunit